MSDVKDQVRSFLLDNFIMGGDATELRDEDSFMDRRILDSTGFIELVQFLEDTFRIKVEDDEMVPENLDSLNNIDQFLRRKKQAA